MIDVKLSVVKFLKYEICLIPVEERALLPMFNLVKKVQHRRELMNPFCLQESPNFVVRSRVTSLPHDAKVLSDPSDIPCNHGVFSDRKFGKLEVMH